MPHAVYTTAEAEALRTDVHYPVACGKDKRALWSITLIRKVFDAVSGYTPGAMTADKYLTRIVFLESVAAIPGFAGGMLRHLQSLRVLKRDGGFIHTLLEEAENERMHLLSFLAVKKPSAFIRACIILTQGVMTNGFFFAYLVNPTFCHRFVGYLEEEAVHTYTNCLKDLDSGALPEWQGKPAPQIAIEYWRLPPTATMRDFILAVRADEAIHRDVNHVFASLPEGSRNPFA
jgi:hypothetical protein